LITCYVVIIVGSKFKLESPYGDELPSKGFDPGEDTYQRPPVSGGKLSVKVDAKSDRLQLLTPFDKWDGNDIEDMTVLIKVTGTSLSDDNISDVSDTAHVLMPPWPHPRCDVGLVDGEY